MIRLVPTTLREANAFVKAHHRHHKPVTGHKFSIGCEVEGRLVGVVIAGRPVSRYLDDGGEPAVHHRGEKRLQYAVRCCGAGGKGHGLSENHHLYLGYRAGNQPAGGGLDVYGAGRGETLDRQTLSRCGPLPATDEAAV